jgi:hypothetical protein
MFWARSSSACSVSRTGRINPEFQPLVCGLGVIRLCVDTINCFFMLERGLPEISIEGFLCAVLHNELLIIQYIIPILLNLLKTYAQSGQVKVSKRDGMSIAEIKTFDAFT